MSSSICGRSWVFLYNWILYFVWMDKMLTCKIVKDCVKYNKTITYKENIHFQLKLWNLEIELLPVLYSIWASSLAFGCPEEWCPCNGRYPMLFILVLCVWFTNVLGSCMTKSWVIKPGIPVIRIRLFGSILCFNSGQFRIGSGSDRIGWYSGLDLVRVRVIFGL